MTGRWPSWTGPPASRGGRPGCLGRRVPATPPSTTSDTGAPDVLPAAPGVLRDPSGAFAVAVRKPGFLSFRFPAHCPAYFSMAVTEPPDGDWKAVAGFTDKCRHLSSVNH